MDIHSQIFKISSHSLYDQILEAEYAEICNQYKMLEAASQSIESEHRFEISRRNSHSRSRSNKREDLVEKMDEIVQNDDAASAHSHGSSDSDDDHHHENKSDPNRKLHEYGALLVECMQLFENIIDDNAHTPVGSSMTLRSNTDNIDIEMFRDLLLSVRKRWKSEKYDKYGGDLHKRNISELRRKSKSVNSSMVETLDHYIISSDDNDHRHIVLARGGSQDFENDIVEQDKDRNDDDDEYEHEEEHKQFEMDGNDEDDDKNDMMV